MQAREVMRELRLVLRRPSDEEQPLAEVGALEAAQLPVKPPVAVWQHGANGGGRDAAGVLRRPRT